MDIGRQMTTIASWSWLGMTIFLILGLVININGQPHGELECPDYVWRMVRDGSLTRDKVSETYFDGTNQYNCSWLDPEGKPFAATSWILFGTVTGLALGTLIATNRKHPPNPQTNS